MKLNFYKKVTLNEADQIVHRLLVLGQEFDYFSLFETGLQNQNEKCFDFVAGIGAKKIFQLNEDHLETVDEFLNNSINEWKFIQINYNLFKSIYPELKSNHHQHFDFNLLTVWIPETVVVLKDNELIIYGDYTLIESALQSTTDIVFSDDINQKNALLNYVNFSEYQLQFNKIQGYLKRGDIYEVNYCIPYVIKTEKLDLTTIYTKQKSKSPAPFASFIKCKNDYLLCASPERFIKKTGTAISCYPMKGTIKKTDNSLQNEKLKSQLISSEKEKAENVMIVDLTRNDLSKIAKKGSVSVKELFGVYEFPQVYQMISTIEAQLKENTAFSTILNAIFPMGSMTGAPKLNAIKIIDEVECFSRELFSGSVGYIAPNGDFDFNVVIRSILYNSDKQQALIAAGGAITVQSNAVDEYNECLLKANVNLQLLGINLSEIHLQTS
jgi:para-aminobenzoate synthetase component 1